MTWPEEAGIGAAPAREAKAASERKRPGCDQALRSWAAVITPTPGSASSVGASAWTSWSSSVSSWAASAVSASARRAAGRSAMIVARCSVEWAGLVRRRAQRASCSLVVAAELLSELVGRVDDQPFQLADRLRAGEDGALAGGQQDAQSFPVAASPRLGEVLAGERFAGGAGGVELVGLGAVAAGRARWPVDLDHPLALLEQKARQSGAEAAGALDRPHPTAHRLLAREAAADTGSRLDPRPPSSRAITAPVGVQTATVCESRCVSTPITYSARSASMPIETSPSRLTLLMSAWARGTARQDCDGSRPHRADRLLIRPARGDQAGAGSDRETDPNKETLKTARGQ